MISSLYELPSITITISEEAYMVLKAAKKNDESFPVAIHRIYPRGDPRRIMAYLKDYMPLNEETAENIRETSKELRRNFKASAPAI